MEIRSTVVRCHSYEPQGTLQGLVKVPLQSLPEVHGVAGTVLLESEEAPSFPDTQTA